MNAVVPTGRNFLLCLILSTLVLIPGAKAQVNPTALQGRERISLNDGWKFMIYKSEPDHLIYDERPLVKKHNDNVVADTRATDSGRAQSSDNSLKKWILPSANEFISDVSKHHIRPAGNPGADFAFVQAGFNDKEWQPVTLPHDWAIAGPFYEGNDPVVGGGMGRLPSLGVAWYRRKLEITERDRGSSIYLDVDGAMSYAIVWLNGNLVGGWPYGYNSFRLDLTPYVKFGGTNQLAIRLDNPNHSARWYPGGGIYRDVWLTKVNPTHIAQWGTFITTKDVSKTSATINLAVQVANKSQKKQQISVVTDVYDLNDQLVRSPKKLVSFPGSELAVTAGEKVTINSEVILNNPKLWGPAPGQTPHLYLAVTRLYNEGNLIDEYETRFGIRSLNFDPVKGLHVNGKRVRMQGVNQHHDLGALGAAFNTRAAERQLEILRELGCNAIRMAHNPPAPALLDLTDRMGFLVINEIFDCWEKGKTPLDFHLVFRDWYEADTRSFIRRDRNHPSVIEWSFGNEVGEQYTAEAGAALAQKIREIVWDEDSTRPATASMNYAKPDMPFPNAMDVLSLNYQGEGIRDAPAYATLKGIRTTPLYPAFQKKFPGKLIQSSETSSALSTRGTYLFPVFNGISAPVVEGEGGNSKLQHVSAYELYTAAFGASPDKVFSSQDKHPYVAGEFVWSGFDYLGEPTPYYTARSSYSGIIDLAGFKKDRFYLYQARWRPDLKMAHLLPHWTWPNRVGEITPVHVFTSGDEGELFLNGRSLGRKRKAPYEYRLRWDSVVYQPGMLRVVTYKNGRPWASDTVRTVGKAAKLRLVADRRIIKAGGRDLSFVTVSVLDSEGFLVPEANERISFEAVGPGKIIATDNGDPADLESFHARERKSFNGLALVIVGGKAGETGTVKVIARAEGLAPAETTITIQ